MYQSMLARLICMEYERKIEEPARKERKRNTKALKVAFAVGLSAPCTFEKDDDIGDWNNRYHRYELLIWGADNYKGVYLRDKILHPKETSEWFVLGYHDSCWRDAVDRFMWVAEDHVATFKSSKILGWPFEVVELTEDEMNELTQARKDRFDMDVELREHPLYKKEK